FSEVIAFNSVKFQLPRFLPQYSIVCARAREPFLHFHSYDFKFQTFYPEMCRIVADLSTWMISL
uniref:Uncharacterized protein n=1 Tax=Romanomermis culicivorax TaxID=13658 RepID=A0A915JBW1_ROMCU